jgi:hypothetical protein
MSGSLTYNILQDDLNAFVGQEPPFVTFGETMIRDTPADMQRAERTRRIDISLSAISPVCPTTHMVGCCATSAESKGSTPAFSYGLPRPN